MGKIVTAILQILGAVLQYALPYFLGKQKVELEHEREEKEAAIGLATRLGDRAVDDADAVNRLRRKAEAKRTTNDN